jgi:hypothetical protein
MCRHDNISHATSSDWESVCADCGQVVSSRFNAFSFAEIELLLDLASGRAEDSEDSEDEDESREILLKLATELETHFANRLGQ